MSVSRLTFYFHVSQNPKFKYQKWGFGDTKTNILQLQIQSGKWSYISMTWIIIVVPEGHQNIGKWKNINIKRKTNASKAKSMQWLFSCKSSLPPWNPDHFSFIFPGNRISRELHTVASSFDLHFQSHFRKSLLLY